jgi:hypothetical protein
VARKDSAAAEPLDGGEKLARLVALYLIRDMETTVDKVTYLRSAGFMVGEVAAMLRISEAHVTVATAQGKKKPAKKRAQ